MRINEENRLPPTPEKLNSYFNGETIHLRSVEHARDLLHTLPKMPFNLVHSVVHDEMCGLRDVDEQTLRVPISFRSTW